MDGATPTPAPQDPLAGLHGYRLPEPVSWWPPAPGWWLLAGVLLALAVALAWWWRRRRGRTMAVRQARRELRHLRQTYATHNDDLGYLRGLSALLRRFVLARWPRSQVAGLTGQDWLTFLDTHGGNGRFRDGPGRHLADAPYRPVAEVAPGDVAALIEDWINRQRGASA